MRRWVVLCSLVAASLCQANVNILENGGVVHAASYSSVFGSDSLVSIFSNNLMSVKRLEFRFPSLPPSTTLPCEILVQFPTQINCFIPHSSHPRTNAADLVAFDLSGNEIGRLRTTMNSVGPGLFTANSRGGGALAAQFLFHDAATGQQTIQNVADATAWVSLTLPLSVSSIGNRLPFLILYGSGFAPAGDASTCPLGGQVKVYIEGIEFPVTYVGPTGSFVYKGVQQINVDLSGISKLPLNKLLFVVSTVTNCDGTVFTSNDGVFELKP